MKESRNLMHNHITANIADKISGGQTKSNISSLKAILSTLILIADQGRVPLSQYINEKPVKC